MHYLNLQEGKRRARNIAKRNDRANKTFNDAWGFTPLSGSHTEKLMVRTRKLCSCSSCGNPRRKLYGSEKLTREDKRKNDCAAAQMDLVR